jgi:hypothetical protein
MSYNLANVTPLGDLVAADTGFTHVARIQVADIIAADAGAGNAGTINLAVLAQGDIVDKVGFNLLTSLVVSDSGATLTMSVGYTGATTNWISANSVLGTATPIVGAASATLHFFTGASTLVVTLTPASGKNLNTVTAGVIDIYFRKSNSLKLSNPSPTGTLLI